MRFFTSIGCSSTSKPATLAVPSVGGRKHVRMRMVVVFPAPFGPRKPTIWPFLHFKRNVIHRESAGVSLREALNRNHS